MNPNAHDEEWYTEEDAAYWGENFDEERFWENGHSDEDLSACGIMRDGLCSFAGSEYCDWTCPIARGYTGE